MLRNYIFCAFREIFKNKVFSIIHILGLSIGLASFVLIFVYALYELSYDEFYENADQIYRIRQDRYDKGILTTTWGAGCAAIGPAVKKEFPEVLEYGRLLNAGGIINIRDNYFREDKIFFTNTSFLTMLPVKFIYGDNSTALNEPNTVIISESIRYKYFGNENAIGQTLIFNGEAPFRITGIFKDQPPNTHLKFNILISWPTYIQWNGPGVETAWSWDGYYTYLLMQKGTDIRAFEKKMNKFVDTQIEDLMQQYNQNAEYFLQPFKSIHLNSHLMVEAERNGDAKTVYFLIVIAIIILLIAWINYVNMSSVKAVFRSKEVAIRKINGATKAQLIIQFLTESFILNLVASVVALILVLFSISYFVDLVGKEINLKNTWIWLVFLFVVLIGPILSGLYPALLISSFKPIGIFKDKISKYTGGTFLRKALVIFQFTASVALVAITFVIASQLKYMRRQELGVSIDQTIVLKGPGVADSTYDQKFTAFKAELLKYPGFEKITASTSIPGSKVKWNAGGIRLVTEDDSKSNQYRIVGTDYDFVDVFKLSVIAGSNFSVEFGSNEKYVLLNEEAVRIMGFDIIGHAIGKDIYIWGETYKIIGILKNYHHESLKENVDALIYRFIPEAANYFSIKLNDGRQVGLETSKTDQSTIETIKAVWNRFFIGNPFDYFFLSDHYDNQYKDEKQLGTIFGLFAILAIIIACLGLFGLSWFIVTQRTKEIGLRKVNGASEKDILILISKDYFRLVISGIILAAPLVYYFSINWLNKFPFRVGFNWWLYIFAGLLILTIAAFTISYNTLLIAHTNPAESVKHE